MEHLIHEVSRKLDIIMEHLGCGDKMSEKDFMAMSDDEKDKYQAEDLMEKQKKTTENV